MTAICGLYILMIRNGLGEYECTQLRIHCWYSVFALIWDFYEKKGPEEIDTLQELHDMKVAYTSIEPI